MNIWLLIFAVAGIVFLSRFILLEPWLPIHLNDKAKKILRYSAPAVLSAIAAPIIFINQGVVNANYDNPYLIAAVIVAAVAYIMRSLLAAITLGTLVFLYLKYQVFC